MNNFEYKKPIVFLPENFNLIDWRVFHVKRKYITKIKSVGTIWKIN